MRRCSHSRKNELIFTIDGREILTSNDFHTKLKACSAVPEFYGQNLDALSDTLFGLVERPFMIVWTSASVSRANLGGEFNKIIEIMAEAAKHDEEMGLEERFEFELVD